MISKVYHFRVGMITLCHNLISSVLFHWNTSQNDAEKCIMTDDDSILYMSNQACLFLLSPTLLK